MGNLRRRWRGASESKAPRPRVPAAPNKSLKRSQVWTHFFSAGAAYAFPVLIVLGGAADIFPHFDVLNQLIPLFILGCAATLVWRLARRDRRHRKMEIAACGLGVLVASGALLRETAGAAPNEPCGAGAVTVLSQNLWSHNLDPAATARGLAATGADIIMLQEVRADGAEVVEKLRPDYPFVANCAALNHWCSLAIMSRLPFEEPWSYHNGTWRGYPKDVASYVRVDVRTPSGAPMTVFTAHLLHLDNPLQPSQISQMIKAFKFVDRKSFVFGGDMNLTPWTRSLQNMDAAIDAVRVTRNLPTWPARAPLPNFAIPMPIAIWPIDHIFAGSGWRACHIRRGPRVGSDHYAAIATLVPVARPSPPLR